MDESLDVEALRREAEGGRGDPIRRLAELVCDRLASQGAAVTDDHRRLLYRELSRADATGTWPAAFDLSMAPDAQRSRGDKPAQRGHMTERGGLGIGGVFEKEVSYPDEEAHGIYESLVGLDEKKEVLLREASLLTRPKRLERWSRKHHGKVIAACEDLRRRKPFVVFAGDVGTGKTVLAETFGDALARELDTAALLLRLSVQVRGTGLVGEMTSLISSAFEMSLARAAGFDGITILLLDEADALASSRETPQMHHEDRAGVNALIQGVDRIAAANHPVLVVFCTNRPDSLDPAIRRRAADIFTFERPDDVQRRALLEDLLGDLDLTEDVYVELVRLTGATSGRGYGFTFSDIRTRLVPNAVRAAFGEDVPLGGEILLDHARTIEPTPPFQDQSS